MENTTVQSLGDFVTYNELLIGFNLAILESGLPFAFSVKDQSKPPFAIDKSDYFKIFCIFGGEINFKNLVILTYFDKHNEIQSEISSLELLN